MNLPRKPNLGEYVSNNMPIADYNIAMQKQNASTNFAAMPLSQNAIGGVNDSAMGHQGPSPFPQNHFSQGMNNFGGQSRQFQENLESMARMKYNPNSNMAAAGPYAGVYDTNSGEPFQLAMAQKFRPQDLFSINKNMEQMSYAQQRNIASSPWPYESGSRNNRQRSLQPAKAGLPQQVSLIYVVFFLLGNLLFIFHIAILWRDIVQFVFVFLG